MQLLVMTGATVAFPELIDAFTPEVFSQLQQLGFSKFVFQYGYAKDAFERLGPCAQVTGFDRVVDIAPHIDEASVVVCPAGAGSILDVLRRPTPPKLVVCVNSKLMDNHQTEIAQHLHPDHLVMCEPATVAQAVASATMRQFKPLEQPASLQSVIDGVLSGR